MLSVRDLNARRHERHIPHGANLAVCEGETVAISGRNGMGKTTLRSIMGILRKRSGAVEFAGKDSIHLPLRYSARRDRLCPGAAGHLRNAQHQGKSAAAGRFPAWHADG